MSRNFGKWLSRRLSSLKNWYSIVCEVANILKNVVPNAEIYVFGSIVKGNITGVSDMDVLVAIPEDYDELKTYITLSKVLEDKLGDLAYIIDLYVIHKSKLTQPPYKWWLKKSRKVL